MKNASAQTLDKLRQYAAIFSRPEGEMDVFQLWGSLENCIMHRWLNEDIANMIGAWSGPSASHKDFWDELQIEVKTTGRRSTEHIQSAASANL